LPLSVALAFWPAAFLIFCPSELVRTRGKARHTSQRQSDNSKRVGLARALSKLGYCSRSQAAELIRAGRVRLNGSVRRDPETPVHIDRDRIEVDSRAVRDAAKIYLMLNKPRGLVTTASDEQGRDTIYSCLPNDLPWLAPVGRLDKASEGLLLLTNDSEWAARIAAPDSHVPKTYHVQIARLADSALLDALKKGVRAKAASNSSEILRATDAQILRQGEHNSWLSITLDEGKNRHIRRMLEALRVEVLRLIRVSIGALKLGDLPKAAARPLTPGEKSSLDVQQQKSSD
jgi:23S rRNA pseudouridine2605 synthase